MKDVAGTIDWLYSLEPRGEIYKLERMEQALALLDNPHRRLRAVHIAGTKGKGSVAALIDSALRAAGLRVGLYTKPHLVRLTERTRIDGAEMPARQMVEYVARLRAIYERAGLELTFFEFTVALTFLYFAEARVDVAVIETGLGGRLDSTNVITPFLSVITPIGFDHMEQLGYTLESIAAEKGGIIKAGVPVIVGARDPEARRTLASIATARHSPSIMVDRDFSFASLAPAHRFNYQGLGMHLEDIEIGLAGHFQHENGAIAVSALEAMRGQGWPIDERAIRAGIRDVVWPGRFDVVCRRPMVILDCAHNELSIEALLETVAVELGPNVRPRLVFACLQDKRWERMSELLATKVSDVTLTRVKFKRPLEPEALEGRFAAMVPTRIEHEPARAIEMVMEEAAPEDVILVTGSVYLIGEIYQWFLARQGRQGLFPEASA
jgi:dihydrofolate synthase/folylpolyglutamate synthase